MTTNRSPNQAAIHKALCEVSGALAELGVAHVHLTWTTARKQRQATLPSRSTDLPAELIRTLTAADPKSMVVIQSPENPALTLHLAFTPPSEKLQWKTSFAPLADLLSARLPEAEE